MSGGEQQQGTAEERVSPQDDAGGQGNRHKENCGRGCSTGTDGQAGRQRKGRLSSPLTEHSTWEGTRQMSLKQQPLPLS